MVVVAKNKQFQIERLELGPWGTNAYIITCLQTKASVLIDAPSDASVIIEKLKGTDLKYILLTHNHMDHTGALSELKFKLNVLVAAYAADASRLPLKPDILLDDGVKIAVGNITLKALHTPGHTPGSLCFEVSGYLISGDTIFSGGPGKTNLPADLSQIIESIVEKIFKLSDDTQIFPGHGEATTLKKEKGEFAVFSSRSHDSNLCGDVLWLSS